MLTGGPERSLVEQKIQQELHTVNVTKKKKEKGSYSWSPVVDVRNTFPVRSVINLPVKKEVDQQ